MSKKNKKKELQEERPPSEFDLILKIKNEEDLIEKVLEYYLKTPKIVFITKDVDQLRKEYIIKKGISEDELGFQTYDWIGIKKYINHGKEEKEQQEIQKLEQQENDEEYEEKQEHHKYIYYFIYPTFDERKLPVFSKKIYSKKRNDRMSDVGYLLVIKSKPIESAFGLLEVQVMGEKVSVNPRNKRHDSFGKDFEETDSYYYDYNKKEFVFVSKEAKDDNEKVLNLKNRRTVISQLMQRMRKILLDYYDNHDKMHYVVDGGFGKTIKQQLNYFDHIIKHFEKELKMGLVAKMIYSKLDYDEYKVLMNRADAYVEEAKELKEKILKVKEKEPEGEKFDLSKSSHPKLEKLHEKLGTFETKIKASYRPASKNPKTEKSIKKFEGYFLKESSKMKLYPNFAQVEVRNYYRDEDISEIEEWDRMEILKSEVEIYNSKDIEDVSENESTEEEVIEEVVEELIEPEQLIDDLFTLEEYEELIDRRKVPDKDLQGVILDKARKRKLVDAFPLSMHLKDKYMKIRNEKW